MKTNLCLALARITLSEELKDYAERNTAVMRALYWAGVCGLPCGVRIDPQEPEWPVVFIELPTGQVSWHIPQYGMAWDNHTTDEKYNRIEEYIKTQND